MVHFSERTTAVVWVDALGAISRIKDGNSPFAQHGICRYNSRAGWLLRQGLGVQSQPQHKHIYIAISHNPKLARIASPTFGQSSVVVGA